MKSSVAQTTENTRSRKPRIPLGMRVIQWLFPHLERMAPTLAHRWFVDLFFSPPRYKIPGLEQKIIRQAEHFVVTVRDYKVNCYTWGMGPSILLVHGWAGRASQFKDFVKHFVDAGYRAVSFDSIAHGASAGKETTIIDFKDAILEIEKVVGRFEAVIGHSLGGGAGVYAITQGLQVDILITIATPTLGDEIIQEFAARLNASDRAQSHLKATIQKRLGRTFHEFMASHFIQKLTRDINFLIIHDEHDKEASIQNAECLLAHYPKAKLHKTSGLGHVRILRDAKVMELCRGFIKGGSI